MKREEVTSSNIKSVGYDEMTQTLEIEFVKGGVYQYANVPQFLFDTLMASPSKGGFFHQNIRDVFDAEKVEE